MRKRTWQRWRWVALSLAVTAVVVALALLASMPAIERTARLRDLTSDDPPRRQRAMVYVATRAAQDPRVLQGAIAYLDHPDDRVFASLFHALDIAARWRRPPIPDAAWLRWLDLLARDIEPRGRMTAAQELAQARDLATHASVPRMLASLLDDEDPDVRYNALIAASELATHRVAGSDFLALVREATHDDEPTLQHQAWIMLGLLSPMRVSRSELDAMPPAVVSAALWCDARASMNVDEPPLAAAVLADDALPLATRAWAAGMLIDTPSAAAQPTLRELLASHATQPPDDPDVQVLVWRAMLALTIGEDDDSHRGRAVVTPYLTIARDSTPQTPSSAWPWAIMAGYRLGERPDVGDADATIQYLANLATLESPGVSPDTQRQIADETPFEMLAVTFLENAQTIEPEALLEVMTSDVASIRELACLLAIRRMDRAALEHLARRAILHPNDNAKMAGAMLAGLADLRLEAGQAQGPAELTDLLSRREAVEDVWTVKQIMRVGLWMQGRLPALDDQVGVLLSRLDLPRTHLLLAMLHKGDPVALEAIFAPRGETGFDLMQLLGSDRWWRVLSEYLPDDAPGFAIWGDDQLKAFQIAVLRNWSLLHTARLRDRATSPPAHNR